MPWNELVKGGSQNMVSVMAIACVRFGPTSVARSLTRFAQSRRALFVSTLIL